jgi:hypothetical protein
VLYNSLLCWQLTPIILVTWEAAISRIIVQGKPGQIVHKIPSPKQPEYKGLEVWLKRKGACFASVKPSSNPSHKLKQQQQNYE